MDDKTDQVTHERSPDERVREAELAHLRELEAYVREHRDKLPLGADHVLFALDHLREPERTPRDQLTAALSRSLQGVNNAAEASEEASLIVEYLEDYLRALSGGGCFVRAPHPLSKGNG